MKLQRMLILCAKYQVNRMNGVKSRGGPIDNPALMPSCNFLGLRLLGLTLCYKIIF